MEDIKKQIEELQKALSGNLTIKFTKTDTLEMEYCPLPIVTTAYEFLYRFKAPVETVWTKGAFSLATSLIYNNGGNPLEKFGLDEFKKMVPKEATDNEFYQDMVSIDKISIHECEIVRK